MIYDTASLFLCSIQVPVGERFYLDDSKSVDFIYNTAFLNILIKERLFQCPLKSDRAFFVNYTVWWHSFYTV
jgi:hypothetical protein